MIEEREGQSNGGKVVMKTRREDLVRMGKKVEERQGGRK